MSRQVSLDPALETSDESSPQGRTKRRRRLSPASTSPSTSTSTGPSTGAIPGPSTSSSPRTIDPAAIPAQFDDHLLTRVLGFLASPPRRVDAELWNVWECDDAGVATESLRVCVTISTNSW